MCTHCSTDMSQKDWSAAPEGFTWEQWKEFHDAWMWPHGRFGYNSSHEDIARATAACPFCSQGTQFSVPSDLLDGLTRPSTSPSAEDENPSV